MVVPGPPGSPGHLVSPGPLGSSILSTQAKSRTFPRTGAPGQSTAGTGAETALSAGSAGLGSPALGRRRGLGELGQWGFTAGRPGGRLRPWLPEGGGRVGERELPARERWGRRPPGQSRHSRCGLPGESLSGKKSKSQTTKTLLLPRAKAIEAQRSSRPGKMRSNKRRGVREDARGAVAGAMSRLGPPSPGPRLPWRPHEPLRPAGGGVAGLRAKCGFLGAARRPRGKVGGAGQACVPAAPAGSAAARGAPPAPRLHGCERLEELAREPTASASPAQRLGRSSPRSGDNCGVGGSGHLLPRLAPARRCRARRCEVRLRAEGRGRAGRPGRGWGANAGGEGGGGAGSDRPAPPRPHPPAPAPVGWRGWVRTVKSQGFAKRTGLGVVSHCGEPRGAPNFPKLPLGCRGEHPFHPQFQDGKGELL